MCCFISCIAKRFRDSLKLVTCLQNGRNNHKQKCCHEQHVVLQTIYQLEIVLNSMYRIFFPSFDSNRIHINKSIRDSFVWVSLLLPLSLYFFFFLLPFLLTRCYIFVYRLWQLQFEWISMFSIFHVFRWNLFKHFFRVFKQMFDCCVFHSETNAVVRVSYRPCDLFTGKLVWIWLLQHFCYDASHWTNRRQ